MNGQVGRLFGVHLVHSDDLQLLGLSENGSACRLLNAVRMIFGSYRAPDEMAKILRSYGRLTEIIIHSLR
ncbi:MAG: hypothetical protein KDE58_02415, partial [Caldilineaceae bacterium]|nr:hypothetical protein [Caldilineaceae bacterium]